MRGPRSIIAAVVGCYALAMVAAWTASTSLAHRKTRDTLRSSRASFIKISDDSVDSALWYGSRLLLEEVPSITNSPPVERMQELAKHMHLDELNFVNSNGVIIASNFGDQIGYDLGANPISAPFLRVMDPNENCCCYGQTYRQSVTRPNLYCKYYCASYDDRNGMVQMGIPLRRVVDAFKRMPIDDYNQWRIGRYGYFEAVDQDQDGQTDSASSWREKFPEEGVFGEEWIRGIGDAYTYTFAYAGLLFRAVVPASEFYEQRNLFISVGGSALAIILFILTFFLAKLSASANKLKAMHRATEARNAADLKMAHIIQQSSMPHVNLFRRAQLDSAFEAVNYPAREVGGDFYGMFELANGNVAFLVADVSGKGIPAAMFVHVVQNAIRSGLYVFEDMAEAVTQLNNYLCEHNEADMFVTAWIGVLDPKTGEVEFVNAGHNRPYVIRPDGRIERIKEKGGMFLGMFPNVSYRSHRLRLERGDRLFLYTDGVTEAMDASRQMYGAERLEKILVSVPRLLCPAIKADVDAHVGTAERSDDLTMLALTWYGDPARAELTLPVQEASLGEVMSFLRAEVKLDSAKQRARLSNAVDELVSNLVNYSGGAELTVSVENAPGRCRVTLSDRGAPFNPLAHVDPDTDLPLDKREVGGLGILMVKRQVDFVGYRREGERNVVILVQNEA